METTKEIYREKMESQLEQRGARRATLQAKANEVGAKAKKEFQATLVTRSTLALATALPLLLCLPLGCDSSTTASGPAGTSGHAGMSGQPGTAGHTGTDNPLPDGGVTSPLAVSLGMAGDYVILAKSGISTVPTSAITGNLGVSPAAATFVTGFSLTADPTNVFSTSLQVVGKIYAADYTVPTPAGLTAAVGDMQLAFTDAAGRAPDVTELGAGNIGGMTLTPGVYKWGTGLLIPTDITLTGSTTDVWIFQIAQDLTVSSGARVLLAGGVLAKNVFWQVAGLVDIGTTAHVEGILLAQTSITLRTGASINGRLLAQKAVSIDGNSVNQPAP